MKYLLSIICFFSWLTGTGQVIIWSEQRKLGINDFKVLDDNSALMRKDAAAITRTGITYSLTAYRNHKFSDVQIKVYAIVHKANTYIKKSRLQMGSDRIAYLLNHEQKHFDISEIYAREATRNLLLKNATKNYRKEFTAIIKTKFNEAKAYQRLYDKETDNGLNLEAQERWNKKIAERLKTLDRYKNKKVIKRVVL